jgi:hypothetical protein
LKPDWNREGGQIVTTKTHLGASLLAATILFHAQTSGAAPQPAPKPPVGIKLPEDRLLLMSGNDISATFIEPDSIAWIGKTAVVTTYTVYEPPHAIAKGKIVVQGVNRHRIDCDARTRQDLGSEAYDDAGKSLVWLPERPAEPIEPNSLHDFIAKVVCEKVELPDSNAARGYIAARALALRAMAAKH